MILFFPNSLETPASLLHQDANGRCCLRRPYGQSWVKEEDGFRHPPQTYVTSYVDMCSNVFNRVQMCFNVPRSNITKQTRTRFNCDSADFPSACQCSLRQAGGMGAADTPAASSAVVESKQARLRPADTQNPLIWQTLGRFCTFIHSLIETSEVLSSIQLQIRSISKTGL